MEDPYQEGQAKKYRGYHYATSSPSLFQGPFLEQWCPLRKNGHFPQPINGLNAGNKISAQGERQAIMDGKIYNSVWENQLFVIESEEAYAS